MVVTIPFRTFGPGLLLFSEILLGLLTFRKTRQYRSSGQLLGRRFRAHPQDLLAGTLIGAIAFALELAFIWVVLVAFGVDGDAADISGIPTVSIPILEVLALLIAAPLFEKIFFRGLLLQGLQKSFGSRLAVFISGTIFGLAVT
ncbi:MAG: lysostaphin resistance A-like protein [Actinomycetota bacterium]